MLVEGERIEVSVDGKKMIALKDSELERGKVAIFSEQSLPLTVIDDFIVRALGKKGLYSKQNGGNKKFIAENSNSFSPISSQSTVYSLMSSISASSLSRPSRFSSSTEKGPNEGNYPDSLELNELNEPLNSSTPALTNSSTHEPLNLPTPELTNSSTPDFSPDPIYQTTSSLPPNEIVYYYHHDHLGNIRVVTDSNGNVVERHDFYPFGEEISQPTSKDQYLFTGKPRDSETGLDYFGARYYSSSLSRWLSADQITDLKRNIENPQRWNFYTYALNNPLKYIDPDGFDIENITRGIMHFQGTQNACNYGVQEIAKQVFGLSSNELKPFLKAQANNIFDNLEQPEAKESYVQIDESTAQELANNEAFVVAVQKNSTGHGHVAVVAPQTQRTVAEADFIAFIKSAERGYKTSDKPPTDVYVPKKGPIIGNIGMGRGKNFFQYANWVFNKKNGEVKYYVLRRHWEQYLKKKKENQKKKSNIKEGGRRQE